MRQALTENPATFPHDRHTYLKKHPRGFCNEYTILVLPETLAPEAEEQGYTRITRDEALTEARWTPSHTDTAAVTVIPCPCGDCALTHYANAHKWSTLAERIRSSRIPRGA